MELTRKYWVFTDYDGTVTLDDNQVVILDAFGSEGWREREYAILEAGGKSKQYLPAIYQDFALLDQPKLIQYIRDHVRPDPCFPEFASFCRQKGLPLEILSDGMDFYIEDYLHRFNLDLPYYSNQVQVNTKGFQFAHPHSNPECNKCGTCKKQKVLDKKGEGYYVVFAGDGISDQCAAKEVDLLFAKSKLARYCDQRKIDYIFYDTFCDIKEYLQKLLRAEGGAKDAAQ